MAIKVGKKTRNEVNCRYLVVRLDDSDHEDRLEEPEEVKRAWEELIIIQVNIDMSIHS